MLHRKPLGKYHVQVCTNISCLLHDGDKLYEHACRKLGIGHKGVTADGQFSLEEVECMGACSWAPAIQVNYDGVPARRFGVPAEAVFIGGADHVFSVFEPTLGHDTRAVEVTVQWFLRTL